MRRRLARAPPHATCVRAVLVLVLQMVLARSNNRGRVPRVRDRRSRSSSSSSSSGGGGGGGGGSSRRRRRGAVDFSARRQPRCAIFARVSWLTQGRPVAPDAWTVRRRRRARRCHAVAFNAKHGWSVPARLLPLWPVGRCWRRRWRWRTWWCLRCRHGCGTILVRSSSYRLAILAVAFRVKVVRVVVVLAPTGGGGANQGHGRE